MVTRRQKRSGKNGISVDICEVDFLSTKWVCVGSKFLVDDDDDDLVFSNIW